MQNACAARIFSRSAGVVIAAAFAFSWASIARAVDIEISDVELSDSKKGDPIEVFHPDTAMIFAHVDVHGAPTGTKVSSTWIAEKTDRAPPNTTIRSVDVTLGVIDNSADFSLSKPTTAAGWPIGSYRVDVSAGGKVVKAGHFEVDK